MYQTTRSERDTLCRFLYGFVTMSVAALLMLKRKGAA